MSRRPPNSSTAASTRTILDELFAHPPVSRAELEQRLAPAGLNEARRALIDRLSHGAASEADGDLLVSIFLILGVGRESEALLKVVGDPKRDRHARACALTILLHADPQYSDRLREILSEDDLLALAAQPLCPFICNIESDLEEAEQLAQTLETVPEELRLPMFGHLDLFRKESGVPAAVAYAQVLRKPQLSPLHAPILAALTSEGGKDAVQLVEALRDEATDGKWRRTLQGVLLRLHTRTSEGRTCALGTTSAYISTCDGHSAFFVLGDRQNPDGTHTLALLCIRASDGLRDGYVATRQPESQVSELLSRFTTDAGTEFVRVPLEQAAPLIEQAVAHTEMRSLGKTPALPPSLQPALRFFSRVEPLALPTVTVTLRPQARVTLAALRALLSRPAYRRSWFIDVSDLESANIALPQSSRLGAAWFTTTARRLAAHAPLVKRVVAMVEHMAIWNQLAGDSDAAELCQAAAEGMRTAPQKSAFLRVLLERRFLPTARAADGPNGPAPALLGTPARRQLLKARFFLDVAMPKGRDLALLDFTEAALLSLEQALDVLPSAAQPREEAVHAAAHAIAHLFRDYVLRSRRAPPSLLIDRMAEVLARACHFKDEVSHRLSRTLLSTLTSFVDEVCGDCPVRCLNRPRAEVGQHFFSTMHPALSQLDPPTPHP